MSESSYTINTNDLNQMDDKYKYCPNYDLFLWNIKPSLITRLTEHLKQRESLFITCANKIIPYMETLCQSVDNIIFIAVGAPKYSISKINDIIPQINKLITDWKGPLISKSYENKFNNPEERAKMKAEEMFSNRKKFDINSRGWLDQSSWRIEGDFFVILIESIKKYINNCCQQIIGGDRTYFFNCILCYFIGELLQTTIKFERTKYKPLIRNKTLKTHKQLHKVLDIDEFVKKFKLMAKQTQKDKNKGQKIKTSEIFAESLSEYFKQELLNKAETALHNALTVNTPTIQRYTYNNNNNNSLPPPLQIPYFNFSDNISITSNESKMDNNTSVSLSPITPAMDYSNNTYNNYSNQHDSFHSCVYRYNPMVANSINYNYNNSNSFINRRFNINANIVGDYINETELYEFPQLSESINGQMAVDAVDAVTNLQ